MGTSNIPDVRVTLSATGVDDIVRAFQNVAAAAKKSGKDSAAGMGVLNDSLRELKSIAPAIGLAGAAAGVALLLRNAVQAADGIGKLQQKTGLTTETLSALAYGADQVDISFESLSGGLVKFNKTMALVDQGNATAGSAVRRLLGSSTALNGLDTDQRFTKVVTALAQMQDGYAKTRAAQDFFGKSGADLIPLIDKLGVGGMDVLRAKAQQLGLILSQQTVDAITIAKESMKDLKAEAEDIATEFVADLAPALAAAGEALVQATTGDGVNGFEKIGESIGFVVKGIVGAFILVGSTIGFVFAEAGHVVEQWGKSAFKTIDQAVLRTSVFANNLFGRTHAAAIAQNELNTKQYDTPNFSAGADARANAFKAQLEKQLDDLFHPDKVAPKTHTNADGGSAEGTANAAALLAKKKAELANELELYKAQGAAVDAELQRQYDAGLISIDDYYAARAKVIQDGTDKEIAAVQAELDQLKKTPIPKSANETDDQIAAKKTQREQEEAALVVKIQLLRLAGQKEEADNLDKKFKDTKAFNDYRLDIESKIQSAQGNTFDAAIAAIDKADAEERAKAKGDPVALAAVTQLTQLQKAKAALDEVVRQGSLALGSLSTQQGALQSGVDAGNLFPYQAVEQYDAAVQTALPHLRALAQARHDAAITPEDVESAKQFDNQLDQLAASSSEAARQMKAFKAGVEGGLESTFSNFLSSGIDKVHGFLDAIGQLASGIVGTIRQTLAQITAQIATKALLKLLPGGGSNAASSGAEQIATATAAGLAQAAPLSAAAIEMQVAAGSIDLSGTALIAGATLLAASASALQSAADTLLTAEIIATAIGAADGGYITGTGTSTSDSIPARLSHGEFVTKAAAVRQPGNLALLQAMNNGMSLRPRSINRTMGFADGGLVPGAALPGSSGSYASRGKFEFSLEEGLVVKHMDSGAGQSAVVRAVSKHKNAVKSIIGHK